MSCPYVSSPRLFLGATARSIARQPAVASERGLKLPRGSKIARVAGAA